jgi:hypothetical protein
MSKKEIAKRKGRISKRTRVAIEALCFDGLTRADAAEKAGISDNWLYQQLRRPEVLALRRQLMEVMRTSEGSRTIARAVHLADNAQSEHVRNDANQWLAGIAGIVPVSRSEHTHAHVHTMPGLTIIHSIPDAGSDDPNVIDAKAKEITPHPGLSDLDEDFAAPGPLQVIVRSSSKVGGAE